MCALVGDVAVAGFPEPVPIIMDSSASRRVGWSGAAPEIVIDSAGDGLGTGGLADAQAVVCSRTRGRREFFRDFPP